MTETPETPTPETEAATPAANDTPPDRLAIDPASPFHDQEKLMRGVGIRLNGTTKTNVEEYCISAGWVKVQAGKAMDRKGRPLLLTLKGKVEAWYEDLGDNAPVAKAD